MHTKFETSFELPEELNLQMILCLLFFMMTRMYEEEPVCRYTLQPYLIKAVKITKKKKLLILILR